MRNNCFPQKTPGRRRRLFWLLGGSTMLILIIFSILALLPAETKKQTTGPPKTKEEIVQNLNRDTDQDGLKDWEEKIYGTNPEKADTDKDGAPDGEEIKTSRNPLLAGPEDKLSILPLVPENNGNKTSAVTNELIANSLTKLIANQMTEQPSDDGLKNLDEIQPLIASIVSERPLEKVIRPESKEFKIFSDNSPAAIKTYFNAITQIYISNFSKIESDLQILHLAAVGNNPKALRRLDVNIAAIESAIADIKKMPVPAQWLEFAKNDIWYLSKTLAAIKILINSEVDPVASLLILQDRIQLIEERRDFYLKTRAKLSAVGITFAQSEPAAGLLMQGM